MYHQAVHSGTGQPPAGRFRAGVTPVSRQLDPKVTGEAFLWQDFRTVTKETATVSLHGNRYQAGPALAGRKAGLPCNPLDLTVIKVRYRGAGMGTAIPHVIGRHSHPKASPPPPAPAQPTGIDYLRMVTAGHRAGQAAAISYRALTSGGDMPQESR